MFTGDTLFIGDVGRPDLIGSIGFTAAEMGGMLYDSLHNSILGYADETEVTRRMEPARFAENHFQKRLGQPSANSEDLTMLSSR